MTDFSSLVARHRDFASPVLTVDWALLRLLDQQGSQLLQEDLRANSHPWEVLTATEHAWEVIPEQPGLYVFVWRPWFSFDIAENRKPGDVAQVLYVGKAGADDQGRPSGGNLRQRYRSYLKHMKADPSDLWGRTEPRTRLQSLDRYLALRPLEYWFTVVPDHQHVPQLEDRLIKMLNPPCNKQRAPKIPAKFKPAVPAMQQP